jgi:hypothetical protein
MVSSVQRPHRTVAPYLLLPSYEAGLVVDGIGRRRQGQGRVDDRRPVHVTGGDGLV